MILYNYLVRLSILSTFSMISMYLSAASDSSHIFEKQISKELMHHTSVEINTLNEALINRIGWQERQVQSKDISDLIFKDADIQYDYTQRGPKFSNRDDTVTVIIDPDFQELMVIKPQPGTTLYGYAPVFNPAGNRLAYISGRAILIVPVKKLLQADLRDNTLCIKIPHDKWTGTELSWSPDGTFIMCKTKERCERNDFLADRFTVWNARTGEKCHCLLLSEKQLHFSKQIHELIETGSTKDLEKNWGICKDYSLLLDLLLKLDQLTETSEDYHELSGQYPNCTNRALLPFLLTAYQNAWRHRKAQVITTDLDTARWAALCRVSQYMENPKLFRAGNIAERVIHSFSELFN